MSQIREANSHLIVAAVRAQELTEEAETANRLKDEFLATVSHEIRTPLNAVLGWARMLESKQLPPERAEHAIAAIGRSASALAQMIDDILGCVAHPQGSHSIDAAARGCASWSSMTTSTCRMKTGTR